MSLRRLLSRLLCVLLPLAITSSLYLYLYPVFHRCAFPLPGDSNNGERKNDNASLLPSSFLATLRQHLALTHTPEHAPSTPDDSAIFRLLVLADPQLEGDSSLPKRSDELIARIATHWRSIRTAITDAPLLSPSPEEDVPIAQAFHHVFTAVSDAVHDLVASDIPRAVRAARKRLDLLGNDYYLAHIYRTLHWWTRPTHVTVLGDLIGSQWVTDGEFERRGGRYWGRVFRGGQRVEDDITVTGRISGRGGGDGGKDEGEAEDRELEMLDGSSSSPWARRIINVVGNHDIGYSGDASEARIERFERMFGRANWDIRFQHPPISIPVSHPNIDADADANKPSQQETKVLTPTLHLINLNTLTLDAPPFSPEIQGDSYTYINDLILQRSYPVEDRTTFTLLLTHLPLHKREGICTDGPYFTFFDADDEKQAGGGPRYYAGGLREQNHLSDVVSSGGVLQGIFGMSGDEDAPAGGRGRNGLILTGHDHTGCDVVHFVDQSSTSTDAADGAASEGEHETGSEVEENENPPWTWNAKRYSETVPRAEEEEKTPSIREVTLRSMMGEFGGYAALLSLWFDADPAVLEWRYEITMCSAGVQHIWWAVHVVDLVAVLVLGMYMCTLLVGSERSVSIEVKKGEGEEGKTGG